MDMTGVDDRDGFILDADRCLVHGSYEEALSLSEARLEKSPGDSEAMMIVCQSWLGMDHLEEAMAALSILERGHMRLALLYKAMGDACLKRGLKRDAVAYFQKGMIVMPEAFEVRQMSQMMTDVLGDSPAGGIAEAPVAGEDPAVGPDFYTLTMADLYVKQGHLEMAIEVLEAVRRREPDNEAVIERLRGLKARMVAQSEAVFPEPSGLAESQTALVAELSRWLDNIDRIRSHAPQTGRHD